MDTISVTGLTVFGRHGVLPHETALGQRFVIDLDVTVDTKAAAGSDALGDTLDYGTLATQVHELVAGAPVQLIETLAERIATVVLAHRHADAVTVRVTKPHAPLAVLATSVSVTITRP